jgi:hypothetical protein
MFYALFFFTANYHHFDNCYHVQGEEVKVILAVQLDDNPYDYNASLLNYATCDALQMKLMG